MPSINQFSNYKNSEKDFFLVNRKSETNIEISEKTKNGKDKNFSPIKFNLNGLKEDRIDCEISTHEFLNYQNNLEENKLINNNFTSKNYKINNKQYHSFNDNSNYSICLNEKINKQKDKNIKLPICKTPKKFIIVDQKFDKSAKFMNNNFKIELLSPENKIKNCLTNQEKFLIENGSSSKTNYNLNEDKGIFGNNKFIKQNEEFSYSKKNSIEEENSNKFAIFISETSDIKEVINEKIDKILNKNNKLSFLNSPNQSKKDIGYDLNPKYQTKNSNKTEENCSQIKFFKPESFNLNQRNIYTNKNQSFIPESFKYSNNQENNKINDKLSYNRNLSYLKFKKLDTSSQNPMIEMNENISQLLSNSNIEGESSNYINNMNENNNNNSFLSNTKIYEKNDDTNNSIFHSRNKIGLKLKNDLPICRSFDFEKNKYKKRDIIESPIKNNKDISNGNISYLDNTDKKNKNNTINTKLKLINSKISKNISNNYNNLDTSKFNIMSNNSELINFDKEENKKFKCSNEGDKYKINIIGDPNINNQNEDYHYFDSRFQDLSTTVFDKTDQEIKKNLENLKTKDSNCDFNSKEVFILRNPSMDFKSNIIDLKMENKFLNLEHIGNYKKNVNLKSNDSTLNQEIKNKSYDGLSPSGLKSISMVSQYKNLLENSFESSNNLSNNFNLTNNIDDHSNKVITKNPILDNIKCIEDTHFNFVIITQASKKLTNNENLYIDKPINLLYTVVNFDEIEID